MLLEKPLVQKRFIWFILKMTKNSKKKDSNAENEVKEDFLDVQTSELNFSTPSSGGGAADNFENNVELEENISEPSIYDILVEMRKINQNLNNFGMRIDLLEDNRMYVDQEVSDISLKLKQVEKRDSKLSANYKSRDFTENVNSDQLTNREDFLYFEKKAGNVKSKLIDQLTIDPPNPVLQVDDQLTIGPSPPVLQVAQNLQIPQNTQGGSGYSQDAGNYFTTNNDQTTTTMNCNTVLGDNNPFVNAQVMGSGCNGRRLTISNVPSVIPNVANASSNAATVMVQPYIINENDKMKFITLKSVKRLLEQYATFKASSLDNTKTLIFFINTDCQTKLIAKQLLLGTTLSQYITPQNVYLAKDKHVEDMLSDYLRPTSRDEFVTMFNQAMTHPRWKRDLEFNTINYYREIFPHVVLFLEEVATYDEYLRRGAMSFELDYMPKMEWGKSDPGGMFRIAMAILHPFQDNFIQILKEEKLKKIASMREFILYFTKVNSEISQMSLNILRQNNTMKKPEDFKVIAAQARRKSDDYKEYKDKISKAPRTGTPRPKFTRYVKSRLNKMVDEVDELLYTTRRRR